MRGLALALLLAAACTESRPSRCETLCKRESECAEVVKDPELELDEGECVETCKKLEADPDGKKLVDKHADCAAIAATCPLLLQCN